MKRILSLLYAALFLNAQITAQIADVAESVDETACSQTRYIGQARVGQWTALTHGAPFGGNYPSAGYPLLLTDGSVILQNLSAAYGGTPAVGEMWKLSPDNKGSYINGSWVKVAPLPSGYMPLYYASAVLPDGRVIYIGGEYNGGAQVWTNKGALYDPVTNVWTTIHAPTFFGNQIGDAASVVLSDGTFMLQNPLGINAALFNPTTLTWVQTGAGKADINDEEGLLLLPNNMVLTVDCYVGGSTTAPSNWRNSELYNPATGHWTSAGPTTVTLIDPDTNEIGPMVLRPDGTVFALGANGKTNIYNTHTGRWNAGPLLPAGPGSEGQLGVQDGPGVLLPNGNVFFAASPIAVAFEAPTHFFEFDGTALHEQPEHPNAASNGAFIYGMLVLPTGQVLVIDQSPDIQIYTPANTTHNPSWEPVIHTCPHSVARRKSHQISGVLFNGMSQACMYGDDYQGATNYPLVRITNNSSGHVVYCRTHGHSYMGVAATTKTVTTNFDVPASIELGSSSLVVVANGIASQPIAITVTAS